MSTKGGGLWPQWGWSDDPQKKKQSSFWQSEFNKTKAPSTYDNTNYQTRPSLTYPPGYQPSDAELEPSQGLYYRYYVTNILTDEIIAELPMVGVTYSGKVSASGSFSGTVPSVPSLIDDIDVYSATMPGKIGLYILREQQAVWGGYITDRSYDITNKSLQVNAVSWEQHLFRRHIWRTYTTGQNRDQYDVVRVLLAHMDNDFKDVYTTDDQATPWVDVADVHIQVEHRASGKLQDPVTFNATDLKSFGDALNDLANVVGGYEWNIYPFWGADVQRFRKTLMFRDTPPSMLPKGSPKPQDNELDKPGIDRNIFEYPGNIISLTLDEESENAATRQFVVGGVGEGLNTDWRPLGVWENRKLNGFPLIEGVESSKHSSVIDVGQLDKIAGAYGRLLVPPIRTWSVTVDGSKDPEIGSYKLGDWCRLIVNDDFINDGLGVDGNSIVKRIAGYSVTVPDVPQRPETVTLELEDDVTPDYL